MRVEAYNFKPLTNEAMKMGNGQPERFVIPFKEFDLSRPGPRKIQAPEIKEPPRPVMRAESEPFIKLRKISGGVSHSERLLLNSVAGLYRNHSSAPEPDLEHRIEVRV